MIVDRGDDRTLRVLVANDSAALSRQASEAVVDRALQNPDLHEAVVSRRSLPIDLLNEMYLAVESRLRIRIRARNAELGPRRAGGCPGGGPGALGGPGRSPAAGPRRGGNAGRQGGRG